MINRVIVMSRDQCAAWQPDPSMPFALVQVLGLDEGDFPVIPGSVDLLQLRFDDVHEKTHRLILPEGLRTWPAHDSIEAEHEFIAGHTDRVLLPGLAHARAVVAFCRRHHARPEGLDLVVHCLGGVSRSVAIGQFVSNQLGVQFDRRSRSWLDEPNPRLTRLLRAAWNEPGTP